MLAAIDFNDKPRRKAQEIRHIGTNRNLPAEPVTFELPPPQRRPQAAFSSGHVRPQVSRKIAG
jgi:hypothetical protein